MQRVGELVRHLVQRIVPCLLDTARTVTSIGCAVSKVAGGLQDSYILRAQSEAQPFDQKHGTGAGFCLEVVDCATLFYCADCEHDLRFSNVD